MASGSPWGAFITGVAFRQYTTSIPITAGVSTFPRYWITAGISFPFGKIRKGTTLVANVVKATVRITRNDIAALIGMSHPPAFPAWSLR